MVKAGREWLHNHNTVKPSLVMVMEGKDQGVILTQVILGVCVCVFLLSIMTVGILSYPSAVCSQCRAVKERCQIGSTFPPRPTCPIATKAVHSIGCFNEATSFGSQGWKEMVCVSILASFDYSYFLLHTHTHTHTLIFQLVSECTLCVLRIS